MKKSKASQTIITLKEWERRKEFVGFTDEDVQLLMEYNQIAGVHANEVVEKLYQHFLRFEETKAFFRDDMTLLRVTDLQKEYFLGLTKGDYGEEYLANRLRIGILHQQLGLSPCWYMGSYSIYLELVISFVLAAYGSDLEKARRTLVALVKIIQLDQELAMTAYLLSPLP